MKVKDIRELIKELDDDVDFVQELGDDGYKIVTIGKIEVWYRQGEYEWLDENRSYSEGEKRTVLLVI